MEEIWKDIKGYEGLYQVSNLGRIKSLGRKTRNRNGEYIKKGKILKQSENSMGYLRIMLTTREGTRRRLFVHRLVAENFIKKEKNKNVVNHLDCNPRNNCCNNLEWTTLKGNSQYMSKLGRNKRNEKWITNLRNSLQKSISKKVLRIDSVTKEIKIYNYLNETKKDGFTTSNVSKCCNGLKNKHKGYYWKFLKTGSIEEINSMLKEVDK